MGCQKGEDLENCICTNRHCARKAVCSDGIRYHLRSRQLPACCLPESAHATFDRSFAPFARLVVEGRI